jgi:hypothetical protein
MCVPCGDATDPDGACEDKDASAPACRDDGQCVQCTGTNASACGDVTPVCGEAGEPARRACCRLARARGRLAWRQTYS